MEKFLEILLTISFCSVYFFCKINWENLDQILFYREIPEEQEISWEYWELYLNFIKYEHGFFKKFNFKKQKRKAQKNERKYQKYSRNLRK